MTMRFLPVNLDALLIELDDLAETLALLASLRAEPVAGIEEIVPAARTLLIHYRPAAVSHAELEARIGGRRLVAAAERQADRVEIPVSYQGEDLDEVARLLGIDRAEVVRRHTGSDYTVAFTGFAPGFAYLTGGDPGLEVPRRQVPRTRIPAGAVAIAGPYSGVYPQASPGGWQILGLTTTPMWDLARDPPALLQPGARVRFVDVTGQAPLAGAGVAADRIAAAEADARAAPQKQGAAAEAPLADADADASADTDADADADAGADTDTRIDRRIDTTIGDAAPSGAAPSGGFAADVAPTNRLPAGKAAEPAALQVIATGIQTLFQDLGRPNQARQGVSVSGAMDRAALRSANRLVGNPVDAAGLETVYGGLQLVCRGAAVVVAVTGAAAPIRLTTAAGRSSLLPRHQPLGLNDGDRLTIEEPAAGIRCYLAVRGGFDVPPVLGSCATDTLAHIGPPPVAAGDRLPIRPLSGAVPAVGAPEAPPENLPSGEAPVVLDVILGPRTDWFTADAADRLAAQEWRVTPQSNRVGLRLAGETPLARANPAELPSEGTAAGAIQVPPNGQPVLFLADHPLTGGYPVIASVASHHLDRAGQVPIGARLRFRPIRHPGMASARAPGSNPGPGGPTEPMEPDPTKALR